MNTPVLVVSSLCAPFCVPVCSMSAPSTSAFGSRIRSFQSQRCKVLARAAEFRPCIDIHKGKVKQIVGGSLSDLAGEASAKENYVSEQPASYYAKLYEKDELEGGHVIMLGGGGSREAALDAVTAWPGHLQIGGGINLDNAREWLDTGASALIVTSFVFTGGQLQQDRLNSLVRLAGKKRLVLDLSCRKKPDGKYYVVTDRWQKFSELVVDGATLEALAGSCCEFLVHGVDVEGRKLGVDEELVELLGAYTTIPTTYAGGVASMDDLDLVRDAGRGNINITVGSALDIFGGDMPYADVLKWHRRQQAGQ